MGILLMYRSKKVKIIPRCMHFLMSMHIGHCEAPVWAFKECNLAILNDVL